MKHVFHVAAREIQSMFVSPVAYAVLALFSVLAGIFFIPTLRQFLEAIIQLQQFQAFEQLQNLNLNDHVIAQFVGVMSVVLLFVMPGITMGLFTAEKQNGTEELLLTSPLTIGSLVLGKYLAAAVFVTLLVLLTGLYPGLLFLYGDPEVGKTLAALLGLLLVGLTYAAIGTFSSSLTANQLVAFILTFVLLMIFWMLSFLADLASVQGGAGGSAAVLRWLSTADHFEPFMQGLVETRHLAYFVVITGSFLLLTKAAVESVRWR